VDVRWFNSGYEASVAITRGEIARPKLAVNGTVYWEWPQPRPELKKLVRKLARVS
jgi:hypothetical protein